MGKELAAGRRPEELMDRLVTCHLRHDEASEPAIFMTNNILGKRRIRTGGNRRGRDHRPNFCLPYRIRLDVKFDRTTRAIGEGIDLPLAAPANAWA
jgi:hypothetical protein